MYSWGPIRGTYLAGGDVWESVWYSYCIVCVMCTRFVTFMIELSTNKSCNNGNYATTSIVFRKHRSSNMQTAQLHRINLLGANGFGVAAFLAHPGR